VYCAIWQVNLFRDITNADRETGDAFRESVSFMEQFHDFPYAIFNLLMHFLDVFLHFSTHLLTAVY